MMKHVAQIFKALGDETRLRIMALLADGQELCVCDIMAALKLPQSTVSRHLSYLRNSGLVDDRRQGIWMYYRLKDHEDSKTTMFGEVLGRMLDGLDCVVEDKQCLLEHLKNKNGLPCK